MSNSQFVGTSFLDGLQTPHYFNGRLLAAEDLQADQAAKLARQAWLGQACGYGVVDGLLVSHATATSVRVSAGLGLNRQGQVLRLPDPIILPLTPQPATPSTPIDDAGRFANCNFSPAGQSGSVAAGAYLLTAIPASRLDGLAPLKASAGSSSPGGCTSKWEVDGLQFKAIRLTGFKDQDAGVTADNRRNLLAHWCFGSLALQQLARDPFHFADTYTGLDQVDPADLTPCDLALAVFYWTGSALGFVDLWAARRRLIRSGALDSWSGLISDKRVAEGQARFLQFQAQLEALRARGAGLQATTAFRFLPPAGFLPISIPSLRRLLAGGSVQPPRRPVGTVGTAGATLSQAASRIAGTQFTRFNETITADPRLLDMQQQMLTMTTEMTALRILLASQATPEDPAAGPPPPAPVQSKRQVAHAAAAQKLVGDITGRLILRLPQGSGFDPVTFFGPLLPTRIGLIERETLDFTLNRSWYDEAIDLQAEIRPRIDLYLVADNERDPNAPLYLMFTKAMRPVRWIPLRGGKG
jgi:hypothetical protein